MQLISPFSALRPVAGHAQKVAAPPYDVISLEEARALGLGKPWSFVHVSRAEIDLPEGTHPYAPEVYAKAKENLYGMSSILMRDRVPCYYVYRMTLGNHVQTGLAAAVSIAAYELGQVLRHEFTRPDKEDDRVCQIDALGAQTGPVLLAYRQHSEIQSLLLEASQGTPDMEATLEDGVCHQVWVLSNPEILNRFTDLFGSVGKLYIADGHHRFAAAARVSKLRPNTTPTALAVLFPDSEMCILDYNRVVKDLNGQSTLDFLARVPFDVEVVSFAVRPEVRGTYGMYLPGQWYRLTARVETVPPDPVSRLDVSILQTQLLAPILGIEDPRRDKRIDFVGGTRGLSELENRVQNEGMAVAFSLYPTSLEELMAVADAGEVMPPKSTWFSPKLADGLLSQVLD
ncbi:conserved hypothetical protein [Gammaproteobacteria bacterium]